MNFTTNLFVLILIHSVINFLMNHIENQPIHIKWKSCLTVLTKGSLSMWLSLLRKYAIPLCREYDNYLYKIKKVKLLCNGCKVFMLFF